MTTTVPVLPAIAGTSRSSSDSTIDRETGAPLASGGSSGSQAGQVAQQSGGTVAIPLQPGRPLVGGGPFTLAVALDLAADQSRTQAPDDRSRQTGAAQAVGNAEDGATGANINELTEEEQRLVRELQARDREVRAHEAAHAAAGGPYAGAPTYTYQRGPDGRQYAIGGAVSIDTSPVQGDPAATIQKAQQIKRAALAPAQPSAQDRAVASAADALLRQAQAELRAQQRAEIEQGIPEAAGLGAASPPPQIISITV